MRHHTIAFALVVLIAGCAFGPRAEAQNEEPFLIERVDGPIKPMSSSLRPKSIAFRKGGGLALSTRLRVGYDDNGLRVSFECEDTRLSASVVDAGSRLAGEDQVRVSLRSPSGDGVDILLSALGQVRGRRARDGGFSRLSATELEPVKVSAIVMGEGAMFVPGKPNQDKLEAWVASISIPWSLLGAESHGEGWTANFERTDFDSGGRGALELAPGHGSAQFQVGRRGLTRTRNLDAFARC